MSNASESLLYAGEKSALGDEELKRRERRAPLFICESQAVGERLPQLRNDIRGHEIGVESRTHVLPLLKTEVTSSSGDE